MRRQRNTGERTNGGQSAEDHGPGRRRFENVADGVFLTLPQHQMNSAGNAEPEQQGQDDDVGEIEDFWIKNVKISKNFHCPNMILYSF